MGTDRKKEMGKLINRMERCLLMGDEGSYKRLERQYNRLNRGKEGLDARERKKARGRRRRAFD